MLWVCYFFGGEADLETAERLEKALAQFGYEPDEFELEEVIEGLAKEGKFDYLGWLYCVATRELEGELNDIFDDFNRVEIYSECYPNYIASYGRVWVVINDPEDLLTIADEMISDITDFALNAEPLEDFIDIEINIANESMSLREFVELLEELNVLSEEKRKEKVKEFFPSEG